MAKIWQPQPKEVIWQWIIDIETEASDELTDWEINFLESMKKYLSRGWKWSESQENTLESIYARLTK